MDHVTLECARCGVQLPLQRDLAADLEASWTCANCGWQMPGRFDPAARDGISENVAPVVPFESADHLSQLTAPEPLLNKLFERYILGSHST